VISQIQRAIGGGDMLRAVSDDDQADHRTLRDFAILYRSRTAALAVQKAIDESGLPYQIVGEGSPYEQPQVLALMALLRSAAGQEEVKLEGYSATEVRAVRDLLARDGQAPPHKMALRLMDILGFQATPSLQQFAGILVRFKTVQQAVDYFDQIAETRFYDPSADAITLLTIHASKGLEFRHVFLVGAEEGLLPHAKADEAEERRLFYVAATRARQDLDITHTKYRAGQPAELSRFAASIDDQILPKLTDPGMEADARRAKKRAVKRSQQSLF
jgi:DNA helicase-2/ATP-dependent DNA helicase PcrA